MIPLEAEPAREVVAPIGEEMLPVAGEEVRDNPVPVAADRPDGGLSRLRDHDCGGFEEPLEPGGHDTGASALDPLIMNQDASPAGACERILRLVQHQVPRGLPHRPAPGVKADELVNQRICFLRGF